MANYDVTLGIGILYEFDGLALYEELTDDPLYYLYREELSLLKKHAVEIVTPLRLREIVSQYSGNKS